MNKQTTLGVSNFKQYTGADAEIGGALKQNLLINIHLFIDFYIYFNHACTHTHTL